MVLNKQMAINDMEDFGVLFTFVSLWMKKDNKAKK